MLAIWFTLIILPPAIQIKICYNILGGAYFGSVMVRPGSSVDRAEDF